MANSTSFHWNAADYAANSSAQYRWGSELIERLALRGDESALDLGCGDGKLTALMAQQARVVTGIDASAQMVELAQQRWGNVRSLAFVCMDAQRLLFDAAFDVVISNAALHWMENHPAVLAGVYRALTPGGRMLLQMPASGNCAQFIEAVDRVRGMSRWRSFFRAFQCPWRFSTQSDYTGWLEASGLVTQSIITVHKDMCHDSPASLAGWMRTTWLPYLQCVPSASRTAFVESVVDDYLYAVPTDAQGRTHVEMVRLEAAAVKA